MASRRRRQIRPAENRTSPVLTSLALHALAVVALALGPASSRERAERTAELFPPPETIDVRFVDAPPPANPLPKPDPDASLAAERNARAADRGPRALPEAEPFSEGLTSVPNAEDGEGGRGDVSSPAAEPMPPSRQVQTPRVESAGAADATSREARIAEGSSREAPAAEGSSTEARAAEAGESPARREDLAASAGRRGAEPPGSVSRTPLGDSRLAIPRRDLPVPPAAAAGSPGAGDSPGARARGMPQVDNRLSRASLEGDFSLSTYEWDYAPYMRRLKKQIEDYTWTILPSAFWYGIAAWQTQVRFTIRPDGSLETVGLLGHQGVLELRHVAPDAVTGSANFEPLPPGFPDPKLTITGHFYFNSFPPGQDEGETDRARQAGQPEPRDRSHRAGEAARARSL